MSLYFPGKTARLTKVREAVGQRNVGCFSHVSTNDSWDGMATGVSS